MDTKFLEDDAFANDIFDGVVLEYCNTRANQSDRFYKVKAVNEVHEALEA